MTLKFEKKKRIFVVDDNVADLVVAKRILQGIYSVVPVSSGIKLLEMLESYNADLILLDIQMPEMDGYEVISKLKGNPKMENIPVIFLTEINEPEENEIGFDSGAVDYIIKPFSKSLLLHRIEQVLLIENQKKELTEFKQDVQRVAEKHDKTIEEMERAILNWSADLIEFNAGGNSESTKRIQEYLRVFLEEMSKSEEYSMEMNRWEISIEMIVQSAALHDIGKIGIPDNVLQKLKGLDDNEYEQIKAHAENGNKLISSLKSRLSNQRFLDFAQTMAFLHHERWDGTGYPLSLEGEDIPLLARTMAIIDVYNALTSERPYREALSHDETLAIIEEGKGTLYDPGLVTLFLSISDEMVKIK